MDQLILRVYYDNFVFRRILDWRTNFIRKSHKECTQNDKFSIWLNFPIDYQAIGVTSEHTKFVLGRNKFLRADVWHFFSSGLPHVYPLFPTHWRCKWRSSVTPPETAFQLNSGTKSDGEECEREDKGRVECAHEVFLLRVPEPRRSEPRRGIKALRAPITLTTRREASHRIDLQGFLSWHGDQCLAVTPENKTS